MRSKYCRRQLQAAKTVVFVSGLVLVVLWTSYFTFPAIFKNAKVDLPPAQFTGLHYLFNKEGNNSQNLTTLTPVSVTRGNLEGIELDVDMEEHQEISYTLSENTNAIVDITIPDYSVMNADKVSNAVLVEGSAREEDDLTTTTERTEPSGDIEVTISTIGTKIDGLASPSPPGLENQTFDFNNNDNGVEEIIYTTTSFEAVTKSTGQNNTELNDTEVNETTIYTNDLDDLTQSKTTEAQSYKQISIEQDTRTTETKMNAPKNDSNITETIINTSDYVNKKSTESYSTSSQVTEGLDASTDKEVTTVYPDVGGGNTARPMTTEMNDSADVSQISPYIDLNMRFNERKINHTILLWNEPDWIKEASVQVDMGDCVYDNCRLTTDRRQFDTSSAVVFQPLNGDYNIVQRTRDPGQIWILHSLLPIPKIQLPESLSGAINWTWTYRPSADIFHPHGALFSRTELPAKPYTDIFRRKKASAVFFSKECVVPSWIEDDIAQLRLFLPIDIYTPCDEQDVKNIEDLAGNNYTFYLGFEDSLCEDYITEQFFHYLELDVVVVAMGRARYDLLPRNSFVNAMDFPSVHELGEYLAELASNENMYITYLKTKDQYEVKEKNYLYKNGLCNVCERLNNLEKYQKVYSEQDLKESLGQCTNTGEIAGEDVELQ